MATGSRVYAVSALDIDGDISPIAYSITADDPSRSVLEIGEQSGIVTTTRSLRGTYGEAVKYWITGMVSSALLASLRCLAMSDWMSQLFVSSLV